VEELGSREWEYNVVQRSTTDRIVSRRTRTRMERVLSRRLTVEFLQLIVIKRDCAKKASITPIIQSTTRYYESGNPGHVTVFLADAGTVSQTRPRPLPSTSSLTIHYSLSSYHSV
jgi:hypothetical protein